MDTSWWLVFAAVVLLALVATVVDGWGRGRRPRRRGRRPPDPACTAPATPHAGPTPANSPTPDAPTTRSNSAA
ncbi:type II toxin-antitoxin system PemK/MazF family toxin, partial [Streptomyces tendae]